MADALPINIPIPSESVLANYDSIEVLSGVGYVSYYAGKTNNGNVLSTIKFYAFPRNTEGKNATPVDLDFDVLVNRPLTIKGKAIFNFAYYVSTTGAGCSGYFTVRIRKWDGVTETEIANANSPTISSTTYSMGAVSMDVPQTNFKIGEYLRISVISSVTAAGGNEVIGVYHDPNSLTTATETGSAASIPTTFHAQIPIKVNL